MKISEMNKITRHYDKHFQQTDTLVIHPNFKAKLHVDALLYQPTKTFPFWKLATMGASGYAMPGRHTLGNRNEYMLFIDPPVDMTDERRFEVFRNTFSHGDVSHREQLPHFLWTQFGIWRQGRRFGSGRLLGFATGNRRPKFLFFANFHPSKKNSLFTGNSFGYAGIKSVVDSR